MHKKLLNLILLLETLQQKRCKTCPFQGVLYQAIFCGTCVTTKLREKLPRVTAPSSHLINTDILITFDYSLRWAVIVGSTLVLRSMITVPLAVHQNKLLAEIELRQPTINMMAEALKHRVAGECHRLNVPADEANRKLIKQVGTVQIMPLENCRK